VESDLLTAKAHRKKLTRRLRDVPWKAIPVILCRSGMRRCRSLAVWRGLRARWDHVQVIVSQVYQVTRKLLSIPAVLLRRQTARDAALLVLRHENAVLRRQLASPVRYQWADRFWFAALSSLIPRRRWAQVFPVTPGTLLRWHRRLAARRWDYSECRTRPGRRQWKP
jgi:putative transposase